jgi:hypothetical protein
MKIRQLLDIQKIVEGRAIPYDIAEGINETTYHSKSKQQHIKIGDMHLHHLLRVFMNNDNLYDAFKQIIARHNESVKDGTYWEKNKELNETKN